MIAVGDHVKVGDGLAQEPRSCACSFLKLFEERGAAGVKGA